jgi:hypothetical protein
MDICKYLNRILALPDKTRTKRRSFRTQTNAPIRDLFDFVYKTFELTSFDQLLRDQERLNKKVLQLDALNEVGGQSNKFMKFFKSVSILQFFQNTGCTLCQSSSAFLSQMANCKFFGP